MCNLYFYSGDPLVFKPSYDGNKIRVNKRDGAGRFVVNGWRCFCTLFLHSSDLSEIRTKSYRLHSQDSDVDAGSCAPTPPNHSSVSENSRFSPVPRNYETNGDDVEESMGMENWPPGLDSGCKEQMSSKSVSPAQSLFHDGTTSSTESDDDARSIISDAEVQDCLTEPGLTIELERLLLRKPTTIHYPAPRRVVLVQDPSIDGRDFEPEAANERIFSYQKVIHTVDPLSSLWEGLNKRIDWGAARILEKRAEDNCDPFIFLTHRINFSELLNDPLTSDEGFPAELKGAIMEQWERLTARYGKFDLLQIEQHMFIDKMFGILLHYQEAVASHSLVTKDAISSLVYLVEAAMREYFAIDYGFRVYVDDQLRSAGERSQAGDEI